MSLADFEDDSSLRAAAETAQRFARSSDTPREARLNGAPQVVRCGPRGPFQVLVAGVALLVGCGGAPSTHDSLAGGSLAGGSLADGGLADAGTPDAAPVDAAPVDAVPVDAANADVAKSDAGDSDATAPDGGPPGTNADTTGTGPDMEIYSVDAGAIASITTAPLVLTPAFSPAVQDYYVRCAAGDNTITLTLEDSNGSETDTVDLVPDQALVIRGQYWIRCLPPDFPTITVAHPTDGGAPTPGYYLLNSTKYAMVLDTRATPVWYSRGSSVSDVDAQRANTISLMPAATSPYGTSLTAAFELHALDSQTTTTVQLNGAPTDPHELRLLPDGDYLLLTYPTQSGVDLTGLASFGANQAMADCQIQEIDPTGQLVWSWTASDHVDPVTESVEPASNTINGQVVVDVFHCNSIDVDASGNLLLSMRHANAVFYIDRTTGRIVWKMGGTPSNKDGAQYLAVTGDPETAFNMQHDARFLADGDVSVFDDHGAPGGTGVARGVEYAIDPGAGTATWVWQFLGIVQSQFEGSFRRYDDGESVIGWGGNSPDSRVVTEVDANGNDVLDISFAPSTSPYRAIKVPLATLDINLMRQTAALW